MKLSFSSREIRHRVDVSAARQTDIRPGEYCSHGLNIECTMPTTFPFNEFLRAPTYPVIIRTQMVVLRRLYIQFIVSHKSVHKFETITTTRSLIIAHCREWTYMLGWKKQFCLILKRSFSVGDGGIWCEIRNSKKAKDFTYSQLHPSKSDGECYHWKFVGIPSTNNICFNMQWINIYARRQHVPSNIRW